MSLSVRFPLYWDAHQGHTRTHTHTKTHVHTLPIRLSYQLFSSLTAVCSPLLQACADKLKNELEQFGFPPVFPGDVEERKEEEESPDPADPTKRAKKVLCLCC